MNEKMQKESDNMNENKTNINCLSLIYLTPFTNPYNTRYFKYLNLTHFYK